MYGNIRKAGQRAVELFGRNSARVRVDFDAWPENTSWYDAAAHHISIVDEQIWSWDATETHGHEYGHSYHSRALGGISHIYVSGNPTHTFNQDGTGDKALLEGFAHFFSTLVLPGQQGDSYYVRHPERYTPDGGGYMPTGVRVEARTAAYLWDLVDDGNEKGSGHEYDQGEIAVAAPYYWGTFTYGQAVPESFDATYLSPAFVGSVLVECREDGGGQPEDIAGIHQCVRARIASNQAISLVSMYYHNIHEATP